MCSGLRCSWVWRRFVRLLRSSNPVVVKAIIREMRRIQRGDEPPAEGEMDVPPHSLAWLSLPVMAGATFVTDCVEWDG